VEAFRKNERQDETQRTINGMIGTCSLAAVEAFRKNERQDETQKTIDSIKTNSHNCDVLFKGKIMGVF
jgi:hypothetical protein